MWKRMKIWRHLFECLWASNREISKQTGKKNAQRIIKQTKWLKNGGFFLRFHVIFSRWFKGSKRFYSNVCSLFFRYNAHFFLFVPPKKKERTVFFICTSINYSGNFIRILQITPMIMWYIRSTKKRLCLDAFHLYDIHHLSTILSAAKTTWIV